MKANVTVEKAAVIAGRKARVNTGLVMENTIISGMAIWAKRATRGRNALAGCLGALAMLLISGCHQDMWNQPRNTANTSSSFFADGSAARQPVEGTVTYEGARRNWAAPVYRELTGETQVPTRQDATFWSGRDPETESGFHEDNYFQVDAALLARGQERFNINCAVCHGMTGDGAGIVVERGFPEPPSFHIDRLREVEDGYIFDVITHGFGRMYPQANNVTPEDRWAIAAYLRALQYSQYAPLDSLTPDEKALVLSVEQQPENDDTADQDVH